MQAEEKLHHLAHHDPLIKLTNQSLFYVRLTSGLSAAQRHPNHLALQCLNISDFKASNAIHEYAGGDRRNRSPVG
ncbi:GGDEF domain-containing protein [Halomonas sp. NPDC076908]|uniref:GGDEF domain-containing protein n=1 Tax=Halomonas sp. NPDC076908 TaxID=3390567 RepID=UPI0025C159D8|nr:GGDEF domain-containing protein [Halomonas sp.]